MLHTQSGSRTKDRDPPFVHIKKQESPQLIEVNMLHPYPVSAAEGQHCKKVQAVIIISPDSCPNWCVP